MVKSRYCGEDKFSEIGSTVVQINLSQRRMFFHDFTLSVDEFSYLYTSVQYAALLMIRMWVTGIMNQKNDYNTRKTGTNDFVRFIVCKLFYYYYVDHTLIPTTVREHSTGCI